MKSLLTCLVLSTAVGAVALPPLALFAADSAPATQPASQQADVPVKAVVLFSSGVGYFEHYGTVHGNGSTQLQFKTSQINDILKSLVLQDLDGGMINTIQYPSQDPIGKTLKSFEVDITNNPPLADLLNQLRGAAVSVSGAEGNFEGIVLGAEQRPVPAPAGAQPVNEWILNLLTGPSIRQVSLNKLSAVTLKDPKLQDELDRALAALAQSRDQDKKPVTINFTGQGDRRIRLGYVVETPVWKTSYRLLLDQGGPTTQPADGPAQPVNKLQGWAIVENQTDNDWTNVQLSLVSGRPISFVENLYQPLYIPRPVVEPQLFASLRPRTYEGGNGPVGGIVDRFGVNGLATTSPAAPMMAKAAAGQHGLRASLAGGGDEADKDQLADAEQSIDASASVQSIASAAKVGELFQYTVGNVSLPRQKSAMIPIITDPIEVEKLSIYNQSVLAKNPLNGARVKNTTGKHLLQGPITVIDGSTYAGDAQIDNLPPGQERLLSYGVDLQMTVDATQHKNNVSLLTGKIVKGVLFLTSKNVDEQTYISTNKADKDKTLIVETPRLANWKLVDSDTKPTETTDTLYRFKGSVAAGKTSKLTVQQEITTDEQIAMLGADLDRLIYLSHRAEIPQKVKDALADVISKRGAVVDLQRQIAEKNAKLKQYPAEQQRIRENVKVFDPNSDARRRLLDKLDKQEKEIEDLQSDIANLQKQVDQAQGDLEKSLEGLNVG